MHSTRSDPSGRSAAAVMAAGSIMARVCVMASTSAAQIFRHISPTLSSANISPYSGLTGRCPALAPATANLKALYPR